MPLASALAGKPTAFVSADVALDGEPVVGSFTVDGLTYALSGDGATLVAVAPGASGPSAIPSTVAYGDVSYDVVAIGAYAFYLSGATEVALPETVSSVDERAFRSSDVAWVEVDPANRSYASYDGCLYGADLLRLLLIPGGRQGAVRISDKAEGVEAPAFSHCAGVDAVSVDAGSASFASWDGLLYDASGTTLLRVPAGAADITIREGCTAIAAGAMEGCAKLESVSAPATVTSISPDVFSSVPTVGLPAVSLLAGDASEDVGEGEAPAQISAMVALTAGADPAPKTDPAVITVALPDDAPAAPWQRVGFKAVGGAADAPEQLPAVAIHSEDVMLQGEGSASAGVEGEEAGEEPELPAASLGTASTYAGAYDITIVNAEGSTLYQTNSSGTTNNPIDSKVIGCNDSTHHVRVRFLDRNGSLIVQLWHSATTDSSYYRWVKPGYVLVGVKVTNGAGTVTDEIRASAVGTSYPGDNKIKGAGRTIAPIFEKVTYNVTLDGNGATASGTESVDVQYFASMPRIVTPKRTGYRFLGYWTTSASTGGTQYYTEEGRSARKWEECEEFPTSLSMTASWTLYARWEYVGDVSFTWDSNGGSAVEGTTQTYVDGDTLRLPTTPKRTGFSFNGWYTERSGGARVTATTAMPVVDTIYYAQWTANIINITWDSCGGTAVAATQQTYTEGAKLSMPAENPTRDGYALIGWYTASSGGTQVTLNTALPADSVTYYAQWVELGPYIYAHSNNPIWYRYSGSDGWAYGPSTSNYGTASVFVTRVAFAGGRVVFSGAYRDFRFPKLVTGEFAATEAMDGVKSAWLVAKKANGERTTVLLNGNWRTVSAYASLDVYLDGAGNSTVTWDAQGGECATKTTTGVRPYETTTSPTPTKAGYTFAGWYTAASGGTLACAAGAKTPQISANTTYYARWNANTITISWNSNGGTPVADTSAVYSPTAKLPIPATPPTREGQHFVGWYDTAANVQVTRNTALPTESRGYMARWVEAGPRLVVHGPDDVVMSRYEGSDGWKYGFSDNPYGFPILVRQVRLSASMVCGYGAYNDFSNPRAVNAYWGVDADGRGVTSAWLVTEGDDGSKSGAYLTNAYTTIAGMKSADVYLNGAGASTVTWDANGGECETTASRGVMPYDTVVAPEPKRAGYVFQGWHDGAGSDAKLVCKAGERTPQVTADVTYYARWEPALRVDAPIEATVRVDILGVEEQVEATSHLESRSGAALKVDNVGFEPLQGAAELFGGRAADVFLEALADGSTQADYSFALDAAAVESDPDLLAPFALPDGYGTRIGIAYRFDIPDDLLSSLAETEKAVCQIVYTVALAS